MAFMSLNGIDVSYDKKETDLKGAESGSRGGRARIPLRTQRMR